MPITTYHSQPGSPQGGQLTAAVSSSSPPTESNVLESQSWLWSEAEGQLHITALPPPLPHKPDMVFSKASG